MATIRKIRSKWQVLIRKHNLKPIYKTFILKEDAVKWSRETEVKIEQGLYKDLTPALQITININSYNFVWSKKPILNTLL